MSGEARYCNSCGRIDPAANHPLGGCTCPRPDFTVRPTAYEQIRSLEAQLERLREGIGLIAAWCESEAIEAASDAVEARYAARRAARAGGARVAFNRVESKLNALLKEDS